MQPLTNDRALLPSFYYFLAIIPYYRVRARFDRHLLAYRNVTVEYILAVRT